MVVTGVGLRTRADYIAQQQASSMPKNVANMIAQFEAMCTSTWAEVAPEWAQVGAELSHVGAS